eukprot:2477450-Pyramimonas_sp.AAC.1
MRPRAVNNPRAQHPSSIRECPEIPQSCGCTDKGHSNRSSIAWHIHLGITLAISLLSIDRRPQPQCFCRSLRPAGGYDISVEHPL